MPTNTISMDSIVVVSGEQVSADLAGEAVILNLKKGIYYGLDSIGLRIWELIQEPKRVGDIRDVLLGEYNVDRHRCEQELVGLLQDLANVGLIETGG